MNETALQHAFAEIVERVEAYVEQQSLPGLAIGVVSDQQLVCFRGFGKADLETGRQFDEHTLFRVASITKTFTTTAILQLRDAGLLSLDDPLQQHIAEFASAQPRGGSVPGVTLRRMLSHHAGLMTEAPLPCWDVLEFPSREALLNCVERIEVVIPQDSAFKYSNLAFGLLGEVVARVSGRPYHEYLQSEILRPLGLGSTALQLTDQHRSRLAVGYSPGLFEDDLRPAPSIVLNGLAPCGGLYSSVGDLAGWIGLQFRTGLDKPGGAQVLAGRTLEESHRPQYLEADWSVGYCLGWRANRFGDRVYHGHGGGIFGFASQLLFAKPYKVGVVCLANVWPYAGLIDLAGELLDVIVESQSAARPPRPPSSTTPPELRELLGTYVARPGILLNVEYRAGALRLASVPGCKYQLHNPAVLEDAGNARQFIVRGGRGSGERIAFQQVRSDASLHFELGGFVYHRFAAPPGNK